MSFILFINFNDVLQREDYLLSCRKNRSENCFLPCYSTFVIHDRQIKKPGNFSVLKRTLYVYCFTWGLKECKESNVLICGSDLFSRYICNHLYVNPIWLMRFFSQAFWRSEGIFKGIFVACLFMQFQSSFCTFKTIAYFAILAQKEREKQTCRGEDF